MVEGTWARFWFNIKKIPNKQRTLEILNNYYNMNNCSDDDHPFMVKNGQPNKVIMHNGHSDDVLVMWFPLLKIFDI